MTSHFIMIILLVAPGVNTAPVSIQFNSKQSCEEAVPAVKSLSPAIKAVCVPKG